MSLYQPQKVGLDDQDKQLSPETLLASIMDIDNEQFASAFNDLLLALLNQTSQGLTILVELNQETPQALAIFDQVHSIIHSAEVTYGVTGTRQAIRSTYG